MKVYELIEELKKCNPEAVVVPFNYDKEMGSDIVCVSPNGNYYSCWDRYEVIRGYIESGSDVVVLSDFNLKVKYPPNEDDNWD